MNPLKQLESCGQSFWLDYLKRSLIETGELGTLIERDGLKGETSNPSIFEKAIGESDEYKDALEQFQAGADHSISEIYEHLAVSDIRAAADVLRPVYDHTQGRDGYISLECSPYLANDTDATISEACRLWQMVERPNLMVKVPATAAGIPAIRELISRGLNINITLLFSVAIYEQVIEAYIAGLETLKRAGGDVSKVASVASFFVSRIDSAVDKRLDKLADETADQLRGKVAIANAKIAYTRYQALFSGSRWQALASVGAKTQRLLWASTSTKNPAYKDTLYVESLIGRETINTMPPATMEAFRDHGHVTPDAIEQDMAGARAILADLERHRISLKEVTEDLVTEGVQQFADSFDELFAAIARRRRILLDGRETASQQLEAGSPEMRSDFDGKMENWRAEGRVRRLWAGDTTLWTGTDEDKWLGWLRIIEQELVDISKLERFADEVKRREFADVVLLGMGGSSLGPEVLGETFGPQEGWPRFHMLDSTDPAQVRALERAVTLDKTMFIVSSKSGSTLEPNIFLAYFYDRVSAVRGMDKAGQHFVAVTDPGSSLETRAKDLGFAHVFYGIPSIGGRYSVLSQFGLVPAAAIGLDTERLLETALQMRRSCGSDVPPKENPGVSLGIAMGVAATRFGRDKVTIISSPPIAALGAWLEQLLAESTGKQGQGLIPVADEPLAPPDRYGRDRLFAYIELDGHHDPAQRDLIAELERSGHPVVRIRVNDIWHIGQEFYRWEIATAVAGAIIGINPFNQPDVEASKLKTRALTEEYEKSHSLPKEEPLFRDNGIALYADPQNAAELGRHNTLVGYLKSHFGRVHAGGTAGDYVAVLAYIEHNKTHSDALTAIRTRVRDHTRAATCVGFGPRFQHSTGQAYKGGPNSGVFLQVTCDDPADLAVPGHAYSFGVVKAAQARGDFDVLVERGRRALRVHLKDVGAGLTELGRAVATAVG